MSDHVGGAQKVGSGCKFWSLKYLSKKLEPEWKSCQLLDCLQYKNPFVILLSKCAHLTFQRCHPAKIIPQFMPRFSFPLGEFPQRSANTLQVQDIQMSLRPYRTWDSSRKNTSRAVIRSAGFSQQFGPTWPCGRKPNG